MNRLKHQDIAGNCASTSRRCPSVQTVFTVFLTAILLLWPRPSGAQWIPEARRDILRKYGPESKTPDTKPEIDDKTDTGTPDKGPAGQGNVEKRPSRSRRPLRARSEPDSVALRMGKVDLSILMALHPDMALFSPGRGRFCKALPEGADYQAAQAELLKRQQKVTENQKLYSKELSELEQDIASLERQRFGARSEKSSEMNRAAEKFRKNLAGPAKLATAVLNAKKGDTSTENQKPVEAGPDHDAAREAYERELTEIESRHSATVSRLDRQITQKKAEMASLKDKIEEPLYLNESESSALMEKIVTDISLCVDAAAAAQGLQLIINDSFAVEKSVRQGIPIDEALALEFSSTGFPDAACNHYLEVLAKPSPSKDPHVKNVRFQEEALVTRIRDHLFSSEKAAGFYRSYFSPRFAWGNTTDLTSEVLEKILKSAGYDEEKVRIIMEGYKKHVEARTSVK